MTINPPVDCHCNSFDWICHLDFLHCVHPHSVACSPASDAHVGYGHDIGHWPERERSFPFCYWYVGFPSFIKAVRDLTEPLRYDQQQEGHMGRAASYRCFVRRPVHLLAACPPEGKTYRVTCNLAENRCGSGR